jgi:hypothetical protein
MKVLILAASVLALTTVAADAQSWGRGGAYTGASPELNGYYPRSGVQRTSGVPKFCYSLRTGKFTHWGECRTVCLPTGQCVKVAH